MYRRPLIVLLALGTVFGYASGFIGLACHAHHHHDAFEQHVAHICVEAARNADRGPR